MNIVIEKNVMVAMRDGVHLAADVYRPVEEGQHPVLLMRLPYNKDLPGRLAAFVSTAFRAAQQGYVVVLQDCRGRFASEGEFYPQFDDANDGVDTIHWIVDQPLLREFAPWYLDWLNHPTYDDYWKRIAHSEYYEQLTVPTLNMGGWYDLFLGGTLANYVGMKQRGGSVVARAHQRLVIGPWSHTNDMGMLSERPYGLAASRAAIDLGGVQLRWHDHWLKGDENGVAQGTPVKYIVMGLDQWRDEEDWPLPDTQYRPYFLHSGGHANSATGNGTLSPDAPAEEPEDVYLYHPRHPVPTVGGAILI